MDCSLPRSFVHGIFQARVLEWVAISFSRGSSQPRDWTQVFRIVGRRFTVWATREVLNAWWKRKWSEVAQSCPTLCDPQTVAHHVPPSMGFSRQEYWSGLPFPSPGESSQPGDPTQVSRIAGRRFNLWATSVSQFTPPSLPGCVHKSVPWVCVSSPALQKVISITLFVLIFMFCSMFSAHSLKMNLQMEIEIQYFLDMKYTYQSRCYCGNIPTKMWHYGYQLKSMSWGKVGFIS